LWVKLSPNVADIVEIADAALHAGAETLVLVNTVLGMAIDVRRGTYRLGSGAAGGGLSGPAIRPVAVRAVHDCRVAFPGAGIVGVGGVGRGVDVVEMMFAGADAVEVGTATFRDPRAPARVLAGLQRWCRLHDVGDVRRLVGAVQGAPVAVPDPRRDPPPVASPPQSRPAAAPPPPPPPPRPAAAAPDRPRPGPGMWPDNPARVPPLSPLPPGTGPGDDYG
jgi:hypothetical protein